MALYQLRLLARDGSVRHSLELDCEGDELAVEAVRRRVSGPEMELWIGSRLVARFDATADFVNREGRPAPSGGGSPKQGSRC